MEREVGMEAKKAEAKKTEAKKHECSKCKHDRFHTAEKGNGLRKQVACRKRGEVRGIAVAIEVQNVVADKVPEVQSVVVPVQE